MAHRVEGVTERLLECAKDEFLEKGYREASLRNIAKQAGSSKGAIYIRYSDKASLFSALVEDTANGAIELISKMQDDFARLPGQEQAEKVMEYSDQGFSTFIDYIYDHFDEFKLLLTCSEDEVYDSFIHRLVDLDLKSTFRFVEVVDNDAVKEGRLTENFVHLISQSFYTGVFEVVAHNMPREEGEKYISRLRKFFAAGWMTILNPDAS